MADENRACPACKTNLPNADDAVSTSVNPTEDYKTSVLCGLNPTTIMECAGRAISFWAYQCTQNMYSKNNTDLGLMANSAQRL